MLMYRGAHGHVHIRKSVDSAFHCRAPFLRNAEYGTAERDRCGGYRHNVKGSLSNHEGSRGWHKGREARSRLSTEVANNRGYGLQFQVVLGFHHIHELLRGVVDRADDGNTGKEHIAPLAPEVHQASLYREAEQVNQCDGKDDTAEIRT